MKPSHFQFMNNIPHFGNETEFFLPKSRSILLDRSRFHKTDLVICSCSMEEKILSYSQINTVFHFYFIYYFFANLLASITRIN